jgi:hypothetical protein
MPGDDCAKRALCMTRTGPQMQIIMIECASRACVCDVFACVCMCWLMCICLACVCVRARSCMQVVFRDWVVGNLELLVVLLKRLQFCARCPMSVGHEVMFAKVLRFCFVLCVTWSDWSCHGHALSSSGSSSPVISVVGVSVQRY